DGYRIREHPRTRGGAVRATESRYTGASRGNRPGEVAPVMLNPTSIMARDLGDYLAENYLRYFSNRNPEYAAYLGGAARQVLERIGNTDALYHDVEHTMLVTLVGQQIIRGRLLSEALTPEDWLHYMCALLIHDIG